MTEPPAQKKRQLPFKPPSRASSNAGPSSAAAPKSKGKSKQTTTKSTTNKSSSAASTSTSTNRKSSSSAKRQRVESPPASESVDGSDAASDASVRSRERSLSQEPDYILAEIITHHESEDVTLSDPKIPAKLLTRLLHHHFQNEKTKVAKDANTVVAKYVDVFVREAIARAAYERAETDSAGGGRRPADGFLEVGFYFMGGMLVGEMLIVCYRWKTLRKWRRSLRWISDGLRAIYVHECRYKDGATMALGAIDTCFTLSTFCLFEIPNTLHDKHNVTSPSVDRTMIFYMYLTRNIEISRGL